MADQEEVVAAAEVGRAAREYNKLGILLAAYLLWLARRRRIEARDRRRLRNRLARELRLTTSRAEKIVTRAMREATRAAASAVGGNAGSPALAPVERNATDEAMGRLRNAARVVSEQAESRVTQMLIDQIAMGLQSGDGPDGVTRALGRSLSRQSNVADLVKDIEAKQFYLDQSGRRWRLNTYAELVTRTNAARAYNNAVIALAPEVGYDLVRVVPAGVGCSERCASLAGRVFSISGLAPGVETLPSIPPYHPNCVHRLEPVAAADGAR